MRGTVCLGFAVAVSVSPAAASRQTPPAATVRATLNQYCVTCHNARVRSGELALDSLDASNVASNAPAWEKVVRKVRTGAMPPAGMPRPDEPTAAALVASLTTALDRAATPNPGRPLLHRLNRAEYANVVRDDLAGCPAK